MCLLYYSLGNNVVEPGRHVYPFTFQVPAQWVYKDVKFHSLHINTSVSVSFLWQPVISMWCTVRGYSCGWCFVIIRREPCYQLFCWVRCAVTSCRHLPSSYCSSKGKIVYRLEAILSRSMRLDCKAKLPITFIHKENLNSYTLLLVSTLTNAWPRCLLFVREWHYL